MIRMILLRISDWLWKYHNVMKCDCQRCKLYRFEHHLNKSEDM